MRSAGTDTLTVMPGRNVAGHADRQSVLCGYGLAAAAACLAVALVVKS